MLIEGLNVITTEDAQICLPREVYKILTQTPEPPPKGNFVLILPLYHCAK